jgi:hypothetical protein
MEVIPGMHLALLESTTSYKDFQILKKSAGNSKIYSGEIV